MSDPKSILSAGDIAGAAFDFTHPLSSDCGCQLSPMSRIAGLTNVAVNLVRIAPGRQAFPLHRHHGEEEWVYVVEGSGEVRLDAETYPLAPGGFAAFPAAGAAHAVCNSGETEMVCLMGGSVELADVIDFPELGQRVASTAGEFSTAPLDAFRKIVPGGQSEGEVP